MQGKLLDGRYQIIKKLGAGGMAEVWQARDLPNDRFVAVKIMQPETAMSTVLLKRFQREFESCTKLSHPNIISLFSYGRLPNGAPYYVMEYLEAPTLEDLLSKKGRFREVFAIQVVLQMARAFTYYHPRGLVHRDLKPGNVMIEKNGRVVLMDFGLVRDVNVTQLTKTGTVMGTPQYMSPELLLGQKADWRSDIFQLGTIAHEMLVGKPAFEGNNVGLVAMKITEGLYDPVRKFVPEVSEAFENLVLNCLETDKEKRYQDANRILLDVQKIMMGQPVSRLQQEKPRTPTVPGGQISQGEFKTTAAKGEGAGRHSELSGPDTLPPSRKSRPASNLTRTRPDSPSPSTARRKFNKTMHQSPSPPLSSENGGKRKTALACSVASAALVILMIVFRPFSAKDYNVSDLQVKSGLDRFAAKWSSEIPYKSRIVLISGEERRNVSSGDEETTEHTVLVTGLQQDTVYKFRVLFPDGEKSLEKTVKTGKFRLTVLSAEKSTDGLTIEWKSRPPGHSACIEAKSSSLPCVALPAALTGSRHWRATLRNLPPDTREIIITTKFETGGSWACLLSRKLDTQLRSLLCRLDQFNDAGIVEGCAKALLVGAGEVANKGILRSKVDKKNETATMRIKRLREKARRDQIEKQKKDTMVELITNRLEESGHLADYRSFVNLSRLVYGTRLVAPSLQLDLFEQYSRFLAIDLYVQFEDRKLDCLALRPFLGEYKLTSWPLENSNDSIVIYKGKERLVFGMKLPWINTIKPRWGRNFVINDVETIKKAELQLDVDDFSNVALRLNLNGSFRAILYDDPVLHHPGRGKDLVCQRIPAAFFKEGSNHIDFKWDALCGRFTSSRAKLHSIVLRLRRGSQ